MQCANTFYPPNFRVPLPNIPAFRANQPLPREKNQTQKCVLSSVKDGKSSLVTSPAKFITSTSNAFVKHCVKLRQSSSYRYSHGLTLVVGTTPIREICSFQQSLEERTAILDCLLLLENAEIPEELEDLAVPTVRVSSLVMNKLSDVESSESTEAVALMRIPTTFHNLIHAQKDNSCRRWFPSSHRILVLDGIQDPGNLGTLLRSAVAFNWGGVFLLPGCCDPFNDKALRASRGASFQVPIVLGSWVHLESLKHEFQMKILAGQPESDEPQRPVSVLSQDLADSLSDVPLCLVLGSEGKGLSEKSKSECELVSIPMVGKYESLNVSVAGGIFMFLLQPRNQTLS